MKELNFCNALNKDGTLCRNIVTRGEKCAAGHTPNRRSSHPAFNQFNIDNRGQIFPFIQDGKLPPHWAGNALAEVSKTNIKEGILRMISLIQIANPTIADERNKDLAYLQQTYKGPKLQVHLHEMLEVLQLDLIDVAPEGTDLEVIQDGDTALYVYV